MQNTINEHIFKVKKYNFLFFFFIFFSFYVSLLVANRPPYFDRDYIVYYTYFLENNKSVEITFQMVSNITHKLNNGFIYLLFFYCFLSLIIKFRLFIDVFYRNSTFSYIYILLLYAFVFFPIWEMTQIRGGLAIGIVLYGILCCEKLVSKFLFMISALLFHNGMIILIGLYLIIYFFKNKPYISLFISLIFIFIFKISIGFTSYEVYNVNQRGELFNIFSFKNIYIVFTNLFILFFAKKFYKGYQNYNLVIILLKISFLMLVMCIYVGLDYPSVSIRYSDMVLFLTILALNLLPNNKIVVTYKLLTLIIFAPFFFNIYFLSSDPVFDMDRWNGF